MTYKTDAPPQNLWGRSCSSEVFCFKWFQKESEPESQQSRDTDQIRLRLIKNLFLLFWHRTLHVEKNKKDELWLSSFCVWWMWWDRRRFCRKSKLSLSVFTSEPIQHEAEELTVEVWERNRKGRFTLSAQWHRKLTVFSFLVFCVNRSWNMIWSC